MRLGNEELLSGTHLKSLSKRRVGLLAHPASTNRSMRHLAEILKLRLKENFTCAFGPQHGMRGDKQDNMIESDDYVDSQLGIPTFSLYGRERRPTVESLSLFDVLLVDLQDIGTRLYTYVTTLYYIMEALNGSKKELWVLDRPNPAGRQVEGPVLEDEFVSFVGCHPGLMHRHGLTLGELGNYFIKQRNFSFPYRIIKMSGYHPNRGPGWGWPLLEIPWINPSPNIPTLSACRIFPGSVLIEGTTLSEGRGTTRPLEVVGAPDIDPQAILREMHRLQPRWMGGCYLRTCFFEPTFHKHSGQLNSGIQVHVDYKDFNPQKFFPFRLFVLFLKALRNLSPDYDLWKKPPYEYETEKHPFDLICGTSVIREWVDDSSAKTSDLESYLKKCEVNWRRLSKDFQVY